MNLQNTNARPFRHLAILRIIASLPLLGIGVMHLTGGAPMLPTLIGAGLPFPELTSKVAPVVEILAGLLLLSGFYARIGAFLAVGAMAGATYSHAVFDWADEPPIALPIVILVISIYVILCGAGSWSVDFAKFKKSQAS